MLQRPLDAGSTAERTRRTLLASIRHELRTPINAILGYGELLLEDAEEAHPALAPDLRRVRDAGGELLARVNALLDPARADGAAPFDVEAVRAELHRDLRTPVNAIIGYSELLLEETAAAGWGDAAPDLRNIREAATRFLALIEDVVRFSGIEAAEAVPARAGSEPSAVILDAVATMGAMEVVGASPPTERGAVLVVDDKQINRDILARYLERHGHSAAVAKDGRRALELVRDRPFDLVLLDILMPEMNGYEVLRRLKADPVLRDIPVIMISALEEMESVVRCIELGAEDYLPKPFNAVLLGARIGACLEKKRLRDREKRYLEQLTLEREKSERLLLNILPRTIAERLKEGERAIAERYEEVTVLFADLVGFTEYAAGTSPERTVSLLNEVFSAFDRLADRLGLEKIKTIGDSYMVVGGLPERRPDHASAIAEMALGMREEIGRFGAGGGPALGLRIGVNVGPVVAGIIGTRKFIYDLWGDTVNTASRMESHGVRGHIQVTDAVAERLREAYRVEERGVIRVKGKGQMRTHYLVGRRGDGIGG